LDEVFLTINKGRHYLWWAVDQGGNALDILVQRRRDKRAAKKFFRTLLKGLTYVPRVIITDKLKRYGAAKREIPHSIGFSGGVCHRSSKASGSEDLEIEQPVACGDSASFDFHPTFAGVLGATLVWNQVVQMCQPEETPVGSRLDDGMLSS
jgi:DDE domain